LALLSPGDQCPALTVTLAGGGTLQLPDALAGHFGVILLYRGSWCPYCNAQLRAFQRAHDALAAVDARVVALSVDDEATTQAFIAKHGCPGRHGARLDPRRPPVRRRAARHRHPCGRGL
jgi:peroxiredoxin